MNATTTTSHSNQEPTMSNELNTTDRIHHELAVVEGMLDYRFSRSPLAPVDRADYIGHSIEAIRSHHGSVVADAVAAHLRANGEEITFVGVSKPATPLCFFLT
jgi:hypothetical protein